MRDLAISGIQNFIFPGCSIIKKEAIMKIFAITIISLILFGQLACTRKKNKAPQKDKTAKKVKVPQTTKTPKRDQAAKIKQATIEFCYWSKDKYKLPLSDATEITLFVKNAKENTKEKYTASQALRLGIIYCRVTITYSDKLTKTFDFYPGGIYVADIPHGIKPKNPEYWKNIIYEMPKKDARKLTSKYTMAYWEKLEAQE